jgi:hypothetical protein
VAESDEGNLSIQIQINEAIAARSSLLSKQTDIMKGQVQLAIELQKAIRGEDLDGVSSRVENIISALNGAADGAEKFSGSMGSMSKAAEKATDKTTASIKVGKAAFTGFFDAIKAHFKSIGVFFSKAGEQVSALWGIISSVTRSIVSIGASLASIPMGIFNALMEEAAELANRSMILRETMEDIRDKFGNLASNEGKAVMDSYRELRKESGNLAGSGRALASVYGYGPEGLAKAMQELSETAEAMGPVFSALKNQMVENAASIIIYQKGLGISNEAMKELGATALARGENITDSLKEIGNLSVQMGRKFGISSKLMGKDMSYMTSNMGKFGSMTKAQMATSSVFVRKLGLEIKDLEGLMGTFDDFETAATNASKLAQSFGMNVDAMQMMKEQDPAKRLDMLRQSFAATGRSIKDMTRQEKDLLAQTAGLDANMVEAALSAENMGMSYDEISAAAEGAADKQLTQEEIMKDMAKNIKNIFAPLEIVGNLMKTFFDGFVTGFLRSKNGQKTLWTMADALKAIHRAGLTVGKIFGDLFGEGGVFGGVIKILEKIITKSTELPKIFEKFFHALKTDPKKAIKDFMSDITGFFKEIFDPNSEGVKSLAAGLKTTMTVLLELAAGGLEALIPLLTDNIVDGLNFLIDSLPESLENLGSKQMEDAVQSPITRIFNSLLNMVDRVAPKVWELITKVFDLVWNDPRLKKYLLVGLGALVSYIFGPALFAAGSTLFTSLFGILTTFVFTLFEMALTSPAILGAIGEFLLPIGEALLGGLSIILDPFVWIPAAIVAFGLLFGALGKVLQMIGKEKFVSFFTTEPDSLWGQTVGSFFDSISWATDRIFGGVEKMWTGFTDFFSGLFSGDIDKIKGGMYDFFYGLGEFLLGAVTGLLDVVVALVGGLVWGVVKLFVELPITVGMAIIDIFSSMFDFIVGGIASQIPGGKQIYDIFAGPISSGWNDLKSWWKGGGDDAAKDMSASAKESGEKAAAGIEEGVTKGLDKAQKTAEQKLTSITNVVGDFADKSAEDIAKEGEKINTGLTNINTLIKSINVNMLNDIKKTLGGMDTSIVEIAVKFMGDLSSIVDSYNALASGLAKMQSSAVNVNAISSLFGGIGVLTSYLSGLGSNAALNNQIFAAFSTAGMMSNFFARVGDMMMNYSKISDAIPTNLEQKYAPIVEAIVEDVKTVNKALADLGDIDINATIEKVGKNLGIKDTIIQIERKPITMNVQLNLTMKADDIAKEIFDVSAKMVNANPNDPAVKNIAAAFGTQVK